MALTILVTGFGPFPGAPFNPTENLVMRLARRRRAGMKIVPHVFRTSYAEVDRELPILLKRHKPDAMLMFGLATRTKHLRIETKARNKIMRMLDVDGITPATRAIDAKAPAMLPLRGPFRAFLDTTRKARLPVALSRNAGGYLCNYLCWRAAEAVQNKRRPRVVVFVHVPNIRRGRLPLSRAERRMLSASDLARAGGALLAAVAKASR